MPPNIIGQSWGSPGTPAAHRGDTDHPPARAGGGAERRGDVGDRSRLPPQIMAMEPPGSSCAHQHVWFIHPE
eukprot:1189511-Prorocentrum_minimum.AAC.3